MSKPDCYKCKHRRSVPGNCHSTCANKGAAVKGDEYGINSGWFAWPSNFDPTWLIECDGFSDKSVSAAEKQLQAKIRDLYEKACNIPLSSRGAQFSTIVEGLRELLNVQ